jgi:uncharacterized protein (DUF362 family)
LKYPERSPFNPSKNYLEIPFHCSVDEENKVYDSIRNIFRTMNLDKYNYGTKDWSPLSDIISKGDKVLIKPNLTFHMNLSGESVFASITHGSVIRALIDFTYKATGDGGKIIVADTPQQQADFQKIIEVTGLQEMIEYLRDSLSFPIDMYDLRKEQVVIKDGVIVERKPLPGDPKGYVKVELGKDSYLSEIDSDYKKFYGADYNRNETKSYHNEGHHAYVVSKTVLESDVIINVPKLKTHKKMGITISHKNMMGIVGEKNSLVHYRIGSPSDGGDEFPEQSQINDIMLSVNRIYCDNLLSRGLGAQFYKNIYKFCGGESRLGGQSESPRLIHSGNWYGNNTVWRTVLDVSKISNYCDKDGRLCDESQRRMFILVDGVIGGEGQGALAPRSRECGILLCGLNPWYIDQVAARLMGFDINKIHMFSQVPPNFPLDNCIIILAENDGAKVINIPNLPNLNFKPPYAFDEMILDRKC